MSFTVRGLLKNAITVADLIAELEQFDGDAVVLVASDYGDISHTMQVAPVDCIEVLDPREARLEESGYSNSGVALAECDQDDDCDEWVEGDAEGPQVIILKV
jgi:hypothetical protein